MKKTLKQAIFSRMMASSTILILANGAAVPAFQAYATTDSASNLSTNPVADATSDRSLTITKYQITEANQSGTNGDGTGGTVNLPLLQGVKFKIQRVLPVEGGAQLVNPALQHEGTDYTIDSSFTAQTGTTDSDGKVKFDLGTGTANDGIYLVTEVDDSGAIDPTTGKPVTVVSPAAPFFAYIPQTNRGTQSGLIYDVQAQPKNQIIDDLHPVKNVGTEDGKTDSLVAGNNFNWYLKTDIPAGLYSTATKDTSLQVRDKAGNAVYYADGTPVTVAIKAGDPLYYSASDAFAATGGVPIYSNGSSTALTAADLAPSSLYTITDQMSNQLTVNSQKMQYQDASGA